MESRPLLIILALVVLAFGSWLLVDEHQPEKAPEAQGIPDFVIDGLSANTFDKHGKLNQRLITTQVRHFPDDDSTEFDQPKIELFEQNQPPWQINATSGWASSDGELVLLKGKVTIEREGDHKQPGILIRTSDLRVQPKNNYLETDNRVNLTSHNNSVIATGMQAWLNKPRKIKLLSNVRGYYEVE